jgi:hypothetical protein
MNENLPRFSTGLDVFSAHLDQSRPLYRPGVVGTGPFVDTLRAAAADFRLRTVCSVLGIIDPGIGKF